MTTRVVEARLAPGAPDFLGLPWSESPSTWAPPAARPLEFPRGVSRHDVHFVHYEDRVYTLKCTSVYGAEREYSALVGMEELALPVVRAVGCLVLEDAPGEQRGVLITEFLEGSLPFRVLFRTSGLERYRERLMDGMAGLLVRLHLAGAFWGDCSLSNTLFRRDAGELAAYLVDAETSEVHETISDGRREQDLGILDENVTGELLDLEASGESACPLNPMETSRLIRDRYLRLWSEVTREELVDASEGWRIQERIRALNALGFTVSGVELQTDPARTGLKLRTIVTDRDYHRHQLHNLTGLSAEEAQARILLNEIQEVRARLRQDRNQSVPLSVAAYSWQRERYDAAIVQLAALAGPTTDPTELYCQLLEHKWFMSEREQRDVGLEAAVQDFVSRFGGE